MSDGTAELLTALATASDSRKDAALRVLRGEAVVVDPVETGATAEPYLTLREIGRRLGVSPCSLWRWQVPGHELGGRRRFRLSEVQAYLESDEFRERADELRAERKKEEDEKCNR